MRWQNGSGLGQLDPSLVGSLGACPQGQLLAVGVVGD